MTWETSLGGFAAGLVIATVTTPVGVSGAVLLLPVQLSLLHVPSPSVTPTNLLYNAVSGPIALRVDSSRAQELTAQLLHAHALLEAIPEPTCQHRDDHPRDA